MTDLRREVTGKGVPTCREAKGLGIHLRAVPNPGKAFNRKAFQQTHILKKIFLDFCGALWEVTKSTPCGMLEGASKT